MSTWPILKKSVFVAVVLYSGQASAQLVQGAEQLGVQPSATQQTPRFLNAETSTDRRYRPQDGTLSSESVDVASQQVMENFSSFIFQLQAQQNQSTPTKKQMLAVDHLLKAGESPVTAFFDKQYGTASFLKRDLSAALKRHARVLDENGIQSASTDFLTQNSDILKLVDPLNELRLQSRQKDDEGKWHLTYQQMHQGVPLWGQMLNVHMTSYGEVYLLNGRYRPSLQRALNVLPMLDEVMADVASEAAMGQPITRLSNRELVVYFKNEQPKLAYRVDAIFGFSQRWMVFVDANTGHILDKINNLHAGNAVQSTSVDALGQSRSFTSWSQDQQFYLADPLLQGMPNQAAYDPLNSLRQTHEMLVLDAKSGNGQNMVLVSSTLKDNQWDPVAVSAAHNVKQTYNYYLNTHQRASYDGKNRNLLAIVHYGDRVNNAFWNGTQLVFGDGDGSVFSSLGNCLDVVAHELTHGVIEQTANLIYQGQSGALNESFADVFAAMVDRKNWHIAEDCTIAAPGFMRSLSDPSQGLSAQPKTMRDYRNLPADVDHGGVHINSGIPNYAAYLTAQALGRDKTEKIYYRALSVGYLTSSAKFIDARRALIQSAEDLYGKASAEVSAVIEAWDKVEVVEGSGGGGAPSPTDPVQGDDIMLYLHVENGRYQLMRQALDNTTDRFDPNSLVKLGQVAAMASSRPAVFTKSGQTLAIYVGVDSNPYIVSVNSGVHRKLSDRGVFSTITIAPQGNLLAYTTIDPTDNAIYVIDLDADVVKKFPLKLTSNQDMYSAVGDAARMVRYADSLAFDYTGANILFDMLICTSVASSSCQTNDSNTGYNYWSIGVLDVKNVPGRITLPFPAQSNLVDLGYPTYAANNNYVIAMDFVNRNRSDSVHTQTITFDFETRQLALIHDAGLSEKPRWGMPTFWGDDKHVTVVQQGNDVENNKAMRIALGSSRSPWEVSPESGVVINPSSVVLPMMHRKGERILTGGITTDQQQLDFGEVSMGSSKTLSVRLSNRGNNDVEITQIGFLNNNAAFSQDGFSQRVARGESITINVTFNAVLGTQLDKLLVHSNSSEQPVEIALTATGRSVANDAAESSSSGGGGVLGMLSGLLLLICFGRRRHIREW